MDSKNTFINYIAQTIEFRKQIPASILKGSIFRHYGESPDPAGLCDGGDYTQEIQIRVENKNGDIYLYIQPMEGGEWWSGTISWGEFFDLLLEMIKNSDKFRRYK